MTGEVEEVPSGSGEEMCSERGREGRRENDVGRESDEGKERGGEEEC